MPNRIEQNPMITPEELAVLFHVSPRTVTNWIAAGCPRIVVSPTGKGKRMHARFEPEAVKAWLADCAAANRAATSPEALEEKGAEDE